MSKHGCPDYESMDKELATKTRAIANRMCRGATGIMWHTWGKNVRGSGRVNWSVIRTAKTDEETAFANRCREMERRVHAKYGAISIED